MENQKVAKVFRSRISVLLIVFVLAVLIPVSIPIFQNKVHQGMYVLSGLFFLLIFLFAGMRYIILGSKLFIKIWFIPIWCVEIGSIISVERSYNPLSSPAASLKRLRIGIGGKAKFPYMLISPVREQEFIEELKAVNPNIYVRVPNKKGIWRVLDWDI